MIRLASATRVNSSATAYMTGHGCVMSGHGILRIAGGERPLQAGEDQPRLRAHSGHLVAKVAVPLVGVVA